MAPEFCPTSQHRGKGAASGRRFAPFLFPPLARGLSRAILTGTPGRASAVGYGMPPFQGWVYLRDRPRTNLHFEGTLCPDGFVSPDMPPRLGFKAGNSLQSEGEQQKPGEEQIHDEDGQGAFNECGNRGAPDARGPAFHTQSLMTAHG